MGDSSLRSFAPFPRSDGDPTVSWKKRGRQGTPTAQAEMSLQTEQTIIRQTSDWAWAWTHARSRQSIVHGPKAEREKAM